MNPGDVIRGQFVFSNISMTIKPDDYIPMRPIPISERLPKPYDPNDTRPQDCDPQGRCWWGSAPACGPHKTRPCWTFDVETMDGDTHWLPHWALPLPLPEVES